MPEIGNIIFMGTAEFAVPSLEILIKNGFTPKAVITAPDKPAGRGQKIRYSPVKECALNYHIPLLQPKNLKDETFLDELRTFNPGLQIVVAFRMLPKAVWQMPVNGTFNLHSSLLPQYRGAAPINHAIMNGEKATGVTTFYIDDKIDTGQIILSEKTHIGEQENAGELHDRLMMLGAGLVLKTVKAIQSGNFKLNAQSEYVQASTILKLAPKIFRENCHIEWKQNKKEIYNFVRGLSPYPTAYLNMQLLDGRTLQVKVFKIEMENSDPGGLNQPGKFKSDGKNYFFVRCADGFISLVEIQMEGKKRMPIKEFLKGFNINRVEAII